MRILAFIAAIAIAFLCACAASTPRSPRTSMSTDNKHIVQQLYDTFNSGKLDELERIVGPSYVASDGNRGPKAFGAVIGRLRTAFPDIHYTIDELVAEGDRVVARWTWRGTFSGQFRDISPTGKRVANTGLAIFVVADQKIVSATMETDRLGFLVATGKIPYEPAFGPPPSAD
jgi:predicted ester cyclase